MSPNARLLLKQESGRIELVQPLHDDNDCAPGDRKSTRLNSSHLVISYAVFFLKKKTPLKSSHLVVSQYFLFLLNNEAKVTGWKLKVQAVSQVVTSSLELPVETEDTESPPRPHV